MKIIKPNAIELKQQPGFEGMLKHIELCGRTCYKSEEKITEDSCHRFVNMLREHAHGAMLEHGTVYLTIPIDTVMGWAASDSCPDLEYINFIRKLPYSKCCVENYNYYITTNYRVILENNLEDLMNLYKSECTEYHPKRRTFKITCNRGVSHEFVRHRVFSFAQESQRYVNYSKDKFGKEIKVIAPDVLSFNSCDDMGSYLLWRKACEDAEKAYFWLLENGAKPQEARDVLLNSTATELIMTGFESDWEHFFKLRCAKDAHPQAQEVANMIKEQF